MKKKVLLISVLYRPNIGGIENSIYHLAIEYEKLGYSVDIISSDRNNVSDEKLKSIEEVNESITINRYQSMNDKFFGLLRGYMKLYKLLRSLSLSTHYDVVLARSSISVIACRHVGLSNINYLLPGVSRYQSDKVNLYSKISVLKLARLNISKNYNHFVQYLAVKCANKNLVFSENMAIQVKSALRVKIDRPIVKPGIDPERFSIICDNERKKLKKNLGIPEDKKIILGLGRFVKAKGFDVVIDALRYLPEDYILCLVGHGVELSTYQALALKLGVDDRLIIKKANSTPEKFYRVSDFFAMSSSYEPLGQTILEAQACGLPVIAFNPKMLNITTAINEVTTKDTSEVCDFYDGKSFSESILKINQRMESGDVTKPLISQYAHNTFSWKVLAQQLL